MAFFRKDSGASWIVVFLGNPGPRYKNTRHNVGFMVCDAAAERYNVRVERLKFKALTAVCDISGEKAVLMKPQTYMNLSGDAVREAMKFYKVPTERVLVVFDDAALPEGKLRIRRSGSAGGHNGIKDIIAKCGGDGFPRIKVGVGSPPHPDMELADWVLGAFHGRELEAMKAASNTAVDAIECVLADGVDAAMGRFN